MFYIDDYAVDAISHCGYMPTRDAFGVWQDSRNRPAWTGCRDTALSRMSVTNHPHIWYKMRNNANFSTAAWNIARWFYYIEGRMGWHDRTVLRFVSGAPELRITPSGGWLRNSITKSLFTLMVRAGRHCHEGSSLEDNLHRDPYCRAVLPAIHRFFQGYHFPHGLMYNNMGFVRAYAHRPWNWICSHLLSYDDVERQSYAIWERSGCPYGVDYWPQAANECSRMVA